MILKISIGEAMEAVYYYYKNVKNYNINHDVRIIVPEMIDFNDVEIEFDIKEENKKVHWDQECPKCHKESLMVAMNNHTIIEQCLLCGYENKDILLKKEI